MFRLTAALMITSDACLELCVRFALTSDKTCSQIMYSEKTMELFYTGLPELLKFGFLSLQ